MPLILTYYGPGDTGERVMGGWLASTGGSDYRWAEASCGGTTKRANLLVGPCDYQLQSQDQGSWQNRPLWWCAAGQRRAFKAVLVPPPAWLDWSPGLKVKYTWADNMDAATAQPPAGEYGAEGTCSTRVVTVNDATPPFSVSGTANLEYKPIWLGGSALSSQVRAFYTDLMVDGIPDQPEEDPGFYIPVGGARRRIYLQAVTPGGMPGNMVLDAPEGHGRDKVQLYESETGGTALVLPKEYPANQTRNVWIQGIAASGEQRDAWVTLSYTGDDSTYTDRAKFTVVGVDLEIKDVPEPEEETPGGFFAVNDDDDNRNGVPDKEPSETTVAGEDDLLEVIMHKVEPTDLTGEVTLSCSGNWKIWASPTKGQDLTPIGGIMTLQTPADLDKHLYFEGLGVCTPPQAVTMSYDVGDRTFTDTVKLSVVDVDLDIQDVTEAHEEDPGGFIAAGGPRRKILLNVDPDTFGPATLYVVQPDTQVQLWTQETGGTAVESGTVYATSAQVPPELWVAGDHASNAVRDVEIKLELTSGPTPLSDTVKLTVLEVDRAEFSTFGGGSLLANDYPDPAARFGVKWYPDANEPGGGWNEQVRVQAVLRPADGVNGVTVYFALFDPDDPSADDNEVDNDGVEYGYDFVGHDNRGGRGALSETSGPTSNGKYSVVLTVAHHPGDNHRVGVALNPQDFGVLDDNSVPGSDAQVSWFAGKLSPLLTVWRKLHVEIDSMNADPETYPEKWPDLNRVLVDTVSANSPEAGQSTILVEEPFSGPDTDFYEGGLFDGLWLVISNSVAPGEEELVVDGVLTQEQIDAVIGQEVYMCDDDGVGQLPSYPSLSGFVADAFKPAYITVEAMSDALNPNKLVDFDLNLEDWEAWAGVGYDNAQDVWSEDQFWAALLVMCYQPGEGADQDPDKYWGVGNSGGDGRAVFDADIDWGVTREADDDNASAVFVEVQRDVGVPESTFLPHIIAHEIGHSAGNSSTSADHAEGGLMDKPVYGSFHAATLKRFRGCDRW